MRITRISTGIRLKSTQEPITATTDNHTAVRVFAGLALEYREFVGKLGDLVVARKRHHRAIARSSSYVANARRAPAHDRCEGADRQDDGKVRHLQRPSRLLSQNLVLHAAANASSPCRASRAPKCGRRRDEELGRQAGRRSRSSKQRLELRRGHRDVDLEIRGAALVAVARPQVRRRSIRPPCSRCAAALPLRSRMRRDPVADSSLPPAASATVSPVATTTRMTRILSRPCSMTRRALVGSKATSGIASRRVPRSASRARAPRQAPITATDSSTEGTCSFPLVLSLRRAPNFRCAPRGALTGAGSRNRTHDQRFTKPLLYQLSYAGASWILLAPTPSKRNSATFACASNLGATISYTTTLRVDAT